MTDSLSTKPTGRTRHRVAHIGGFLGFFRKQVLILQYELTGYVITNVGGFVDGSTETWWVDARPEWVMQVAEAAITAAKANEAADAAVKADLSARRGEY